MQHCEAPPPIACIPVLQENSRVGVIKDARPLFAPTSFTTPSVDTTAAAAAAGTAAAAATAAGTAALPAASAGLSARHSLDSLAQSVLSGPKRSLSASHRRLQTHAVTSTGARPGQATRDSLANISMNLPEAPAAFRHIAAGPSHFSGLHHGSARPTHCHSTDLMGLAKMSVSSIEQLRGGLPSSTIVSGHRSSKKGNDSSVSLVLPDSPKRVHAKKRSTDALSAAQIASVGSHADSTGARAGAAGLFGSALLEAGPPRLLASSSSQNDAVHAAHGSDADVRAGVNSPGVLMSANSGSLSAAGAVALPLRQSDFSRYARPGHSGLMQLYGCLHLHCQHQQSSCGITRHYIIHHCPVLPYLQTRHYIIHLCLFLPYMQTVTKQFNLHRWAQLHNDAA